MQGKLPSLEALPIVTVAIRPNGGIGKIKIYHPTEGILSNNFYHIKTKFILNHYIPKIFLI
jgi:hypothetical protein